MTSGAAENIIRSRLLILQSKRMLLASAQRRATGTGSAMLRARAKLLRVEVEAADDAYRGALLALGSPQQSEYWRVAYARLVEVGDELAAALARASMKLPPGERFRMSADVERLEHVVDGWSDALRATIGAA